MPQTPFDVSLSQKNTDFVVHVEGEVDLSAAPRLEETLLGAIEAGAVRIVLDFSQVIFIDSEGIRVLIRAYRQLLERGGSMSVRRCAPNVVRTFELLGLQRCFDIHLRRDSGD
jgi:anti-sigma B factor antagonist